MITSYNNNVSLQTTNSLPLVAQAKRGGVRKTILCNWTKTDGLMINNTWLSWAPSLVSMESADVTFPFDRDEQISVLENEALVYFNHTEQYPTLTKDLAQYTIALMLLAENDVKGATNQLESFIYKTTDLETIKTADYNASMSSDGYLISNEFPSEIHPIWRVQYSAYLALVSLYLKNGGNEKSDALMQKITTKCASDGWLWGINYSIASIVSNTENNKFANEQLSLCEKGIKKQADLQAIRMENLNLQGYLMKDTTMTWQEQSLKKYESILQQIEKKRNN